MAAMNDPNPPARVEDKRGAIWEVLFPFQDGDYENQEKSTGICISGNRILTVHHSISFMTKTKGIVARRMGTANYRRLKIEYGRKGLDMVLLRFKSKTYQSPIRLKISKIDKLDIGDHRWLIGNNDYEFDAFIEPITVCSPCGPILDNYNSFEPNPVPRPPRTYTLLGDVDSRFNTNPNVPIILIQPYRFAHGNSGSALVDEWGRLVGMLKGSVETVDNEGIWRAVLHVSGIREFLEEAKCARERASSRRSRALGFCSYARFRRGAMELPL